MIQISGKETDFKQSYGNSPINVQQYSNQFKQLQDFDSQLEEIIVKEQSHHPNTAANKKFSPKRHTKINKRSSLEQNSQTERKASNQFILFSKISQLQKICQTLTSANEKLIDKIEVYQEQNDQLKNRIKLIEKSKGNSLYQFQSIDQDIEELGDILNDIQEQKFEISVKQMNQEDHEQTILQQQVTDIEKLIQQYRFLLKAAEQQSKTLLKAAEQQNTTIKINYEKQIDLLQQQLNQTKSQLQQTTFKLFEVQSINKELEEQFISLQEKNQNLEGQIQKIINYRQESYDQTSSRNRSQKRSAQRLAPILNCDSRNNTWNYNKEYNQQISSFNSTIELQLQSLIQKLIKQLSHQRNIKQSMAEEIKRIQKEFFDSEKQIMMKNKKIYQLQMKLIRDKKQSNEQFYAVLHNESRKSYDRKKDEKPRLFKQIQTKQTNKNANFHSPSVKDRIYKVIQKSQKPNINIPITHNSLNNKTNADLRSIQRETSHNSKVSQSLVSSQNKFLQTFSLIQLLSQAKIALTNKEKLHICLKLIEFYEKKIYKDKNYKLLMLQNLIVTNFNRFNFRLIKIKVEDKPGSQNEISQRNRRNCYDEYANHPEMVIGNLSFLLNSFLMNVESKQDDFGSLESQACLLELIDSMLDNRSLDLQGLKQLRFLVEKAIQKRSF